MSDRSAEERPSRPKDVRKGFSVEIKTYTHGAKRLLTSPEFVRNQIGIMLDALGLAEEIDYTVEVARIYGNDWAKD